MCKERPGGVGGPEKDPSSRQPHEWASGPSATPTEGESRAEPGGSSRGPQAGLSGPQVLAQRSWGAALLQAQHQARGGQTAE